MFAEAGAHNVLSMTRNSIRWVVTMVVALSFVTATTIEGAAAARKPRRGSSTTVLTPPYATPTTASSSCATTISVSDSCHERITADTSGATSAAIDVLVGDNVYLSRSYAAYTTASYTIPFTTTAPRTSIRVNALVRVTAASSVMDRPAYAWSSGTPVLETDAVAKIGEGCCGIGSGTRVVFTAIRADSPSDNHLQDVDSGDYNLAFDWTPSGGIAAGTHQITVALRQRVDAVSNDRFHSTLDAIVQSITVTERWG